MHWAQFIATCASFAAMAGGASAVYFPLATRREARRVAALQATVSAAVELGLVDVKASVQALDVRTAETDRKLAVQFGGNGGGMRQAINEHGEKLSYLAGRVDQLARASH